jgi:hypothetical protein
MPVAGGRGRPLKLYVLSLAGLWFLALMIGVVEKDLLHWPSVYWYPFFLPAARFSDFTIFQPRFQHFGTAAFFSMPGFPFTYPAPVALAFHGFYLFGARALALYLGFCFAVCFGACAILAFAMHRRGAGFLACAGFAGAGFLLSYPFWFLADRANIEMVNFLAVALGVTCYWKKLWFGAATFLGLAAALKLYPIVYIALLLSAHRYAATAWSLAVAAAVTAGSIFLLGSSYRVSAAGIANGLAFFRTTYALQIRPTEIGFDHSLFALVKKIALASVPDPGVLLDGYLLLAAAFGLALYAWKIRNLPRANQILALTVCAILLPPVSSDYTLMNLYIPWAVLVLIAVSGNQGRGVMLSLVCMAILMAPESYLFLHGVRIAGQFKAVALMALLAISVIYPIEESSPTKTPNVASRLAIPRP